MHGAVIHAGTLATEQLTSHKIFTFWTPGKVAIINTHGTILHIATTSPHFVDPLWSKLHIRHTLIKAHSTCEEIRGVGTIWPLCSPFSLLQAAYLCTSRRTTKFKLSLLPDGYFFTTGSSPLVPTISRNAYTNGHIVESTEAQVVLIHQMGPSLSCTANRLKLNASHYGDACNLTQTQFTYPSWLACRKDDHKPRMRKRVALAPPTTLHADTCGRYTSL